MVENRLSGFSDLFLMLASARAFYFNNAFVFKPFHTFTKTFGRRTGPGGGQREHILGGRYNKLP